MKFLNLIYKYSFIFILFIYSCSESPIVPETGLDEASMEAYASMASTGISTSIATPYNNLFTRYGNGWTGGDAVYSIALPDSRVLWLFGDSFLDTVYADRSRPGSSLIRNTFMVQQGKVFTTLVGGTIDDPSPMVGTDDPDNEWYWPLDGTVVGDELHIFMAYFIRTGSGAWDFSYQRTDRVTYSLPAITETSRTTVSENPDVEYGAAVMEDGDYIYIYGAEFVPLTKYLQVARVPADNISAPWEYYDGSAWSASFPGDDGRLVKGNGLPVDVSAQFSVFYHEGKYRLLTQEGFLGPKIHTYESTSPTGPWKKKTLVYTTPESGSLFTYNALIHPEIVKPGSSSILMSYCVNTSNFFELFSNADSYRPYFVWVDFL